MKWVDRWFARKWRWAWENRDTLGEAMTSGQIRPARLATVEDESWEDGLRITIKKMIGGSVVSFRIYDRVRDRSDSRHYIITDDEDFNTELCKIITMESMKQSA